MLRIGARRALLTGPHPPGSSRLCRLRGFHHWFTARYTVLPCLPDPGRLAVPTRPVVVRAAPTLPGASQAGLPSASAGLLRQPNGGSFHPTRSHSASWRTALSAWTFSGRQRRPPAGVRTLGMSSSSASNTRLSLVLAAVTTSDSGSPLPSAARCSLDPGLARSTGFAPHRSPPDRPQAGRIHTDPRPVQPAGLAELAQQQLLEPLEHPGGGPLGEPPPTGGHAAAAELAHRQQRPGGGGTGHEDDRGHARPVRHGPGRATAGVGRRRGQKGLEALPKLLGQQPVGQ